MLQESKKVRFSFSVWLYADRSSEKVAWEQWKWKKSVICLKSENLHKHRGTAEDKMSIMGKKANNLSLTNLSFEIATFFIPRDKAVVGPK